MAKPSRDLIRFLTGWEGYVRCAEDDGFGTLTIGYGTTESDRDVRPGMCISERKARRWLKKNLAEKYLGAIPRLNRLSQKEVDALLSIAYNAGIGVVADPGFSSLARRLRSPEGREAGDRKGIYREEFPKWNKAGNPLRPVLGLTKRRNAELAMALYGDYSGRP